MEPKEVTEKIVKELSPKIIILCKEFSADFAKENENVTFNLIQAGVTSSVAHVLKALVEVAATQYGPVFKKDEMLEDIISHLKS
jgi:hypothetical protein